MKEIPIKNAPPVLKRMSEETYEQGRTSDEPLEKYAKLHNSLENFRDEIHQIIIPGESFDIKDLEIIDNHLNGLLGAIHKAVLFKKQEAN